MTRVLMKGNEAIAEAAIRAGCGAYFGYPITPQTELAEYMARHLPEAGGVFLQAESEVAAINMVYGAAGAGARAMTSTSSPGFSLMMEGLSYIVGARLPCVVVNVMRGGPGLGNIAPSQGDYFQATRSLGHGDSHGIVLAPSTVQEAIELVGLAFDLAERYRLPTSIAADGLLGQMMEPVILPEPRTAPPAPAWATTGAERDRRADQLGVSGARRPRAACARPDGDLPRDRSDTSRGSRRTVRTTPTSWSWPTGRWPASRVRPWTASAS